MVSVIELGSTATRQRQRSAHRAATDGKSLLPLAPVEQPIYPGPSRRAKSTHATGLGEVGDFRADLVKYLGAVMGAQKAEASVAGFEALVKKRAEEGAAKVVKKLILVQASLIAAVIFAAVLLRKA